MSSSHSHRQFLLPAFFLESGSYFPLFVCLVIFCWKLSIFNKITILGPRPTPPLLWGFLLLFACLPGDWLDYFGEVCSFSPAVFSLWCFPSGRYIGVPTVTLACSLGCGLIGSLNLLPHAFDHNPPLS